MMHAFVTRQSLEAMIIRVRFRFKSHQLILRRSVNDSTEIQKEGEPEI